MSNRESPFYWSFPCGTFFRTRVRVSVWFPLIVLVICFRLRGLENGLQVGLAFSGVLFLSVLAHEFGHVLAARRTGGGGDEILIWPLGGLAFVQPAATFVSQFFTTAAGPLTNLALCLIVLPAVWGSPHAGDALNPLVMPAVGLSEAAVQDLLLLTFAANWMLLLVNLIPVYPLDGGRMLQTTLSAWIGGESAIDTYLRIGFIAGAVGILGGLLFDSSWIVAIAAVVLVLNLYESVQLRMADAYGDESFMGYDFSQGYTSLERSGHDPGEPQRHPGFLQRWRERRRAEKERRLAEQAAEVEQQLDAILDKIHQHGRESLTESELRLLERASARYRDKGPSPG